MDPPREANGEVRERGRGLAGGVAFFPAHG